MYVCLLIQKVSEEPDVDVDVCCQHLMKMAAAEPSGCFKSCRAEAAMMWNSNILWWCYRLGLNRHWAQMRSLQTWGHSDPFIVGIISNSRLCLFSTLSLWTSKKSKDSDTFLPIAQHLWSKNTNHTLLTSVLCHIGHCTTHTLSAWKNYFIKSEKSQNLDSLTSPLHTYTHSDEIWRQKLLATERAEAIVAHMNRILCCNVKNMCTRSMVWSFHFPTADHTIFKQTYRPVSAVPRLRMFSGQPFEWEN